MKGLKNKISAIRIASLSLLVAPAFILQSCHDANARKDNTPTDVVLTRPDGALTELTRSLAEGDAPGFAAICVYPIVRPYPLRNIEDSVSMVDYFPTLVDETLRTMFKKSSLDDWESYGWRGWSIAGSTPLWYDDGVQIISYISPAEAGLQRMLAREEIMSLAPQFRDGWIPVMVLTEIDGDRVFRIDSKDESYRLMGFDRSANLGNAPALLLLGSMRTEGSANLPIYKFSDPEGIEAEFIPDAPDPAISMKRPQSDDIDACPVRPAYWRDLIKK